MKTPGREGSGVNGCAELGATCGSRDSQDQPCQADQDDLAHRCHRRRSLALSTRGPTRRRRRRLRSACSGAGGGRRRPRCPWQRRIRHSSAMTGGRGRRCAGDRSWFVGSWMSFTEADSDYSATTVSKRLRAPHRLP